MTDLRQTKEFARFLKSQDWVVKKIGQDYCFIRKFPLTPFSVIKIQRLQSIDFQKIDQLAKKHRALATYIEPKISRIGNWKLKIEKNGYHLSGSPFLPTRTIHLDLTQSQKKLLSGMKKDARYSIRKARKTCEVTERSKKTASLKAFHQAWKKSVPFSRYVPSLKTLENLQAAFGPKALFLSISSPDYYDSNHSNQSPVKNKSNYQTGDRIIAGTVVLLTDIAAYYYYAFTSKKGRKKLAQYLLVWEAIKIVKKRGCKIFDFEGIYDQRFPIKNWQGFSHFKKSFGGREVRFPGCYVKKKLPGQP